MTLKLKGENGMGQRQLLHFDFTYTVLYKQHPGNSFSIKNPSFLSVGVEREVKQVEEDIELRDCMAKLCGHLSYY